MNNNSPGAEQAAVGDLAETLNEALKPYRREWKRRERLSTHLERCVRAAKKGDFFALSELAQAKTTTAAGDEVELEGVGKLLGHLSAWANGEIDRYRTRFLEDLGQLAAEAELPLEIDFPRFSVLKGIDGEFDFARRTTMINKKAVKTVDPKRIIKALVAVKRNLYGRSLEPKAFLEGLFGSYKKCLRQSGRTVGHPVPIQDFYMAHVMSMQSKTFFQNLDKARFKGYPLQHFSVDLWRFFSSDVETTEDGHMLTLRGGRGQSLWLLDPEGEKRQITTVAFHQRGD